MYISTMNGSGLTAMNNTLIEHPFYIFKALLAMNLVGKFPWEHPNLFVIMIVQLSLLSHLSHLSLVSQSSAL